MKNGELSKQLGSFHTNYIISRNVEDYPKNKKISKNKILSRKIENILEFLEAFYFLT
jgi:hypothetical protein